MLALVFAFVCVCICVRFRLLFVKLQAHLCFFSRVAMEVASTVVASEDCGTTAFARCACKRRRRTVLSEDLQEWLRFIDPSGAFLARYGQRIAEHFDNVDQFMEYRKSTRSHTQAWFEVVDPVLFQVLDIRLADRPLLARAILALQ